MRQRECLIVVLISVLMVGSHGANSQNAGIGGQNAGTGGAHRVNFAEAAKSPDARTLLAKHEVFDPETEPGVPSRPTTGTRKQYATAPVAPPQALRIRPCIVAIFPCPFDGVAQGTFGSPPDPNAAVGVWGVSSKLSTTRSGSQTGWVQCCVVAPSFCRAFWGPATT